MLFFVGDSYRIVRTQMDGAAWETFGASGSGIGEFNVISDISYDPASEFLYIADPVNYRIVKTKFGDTAEWVSLGSYGSGVGQFGDPGGVHYDPASDYLYVADHANSRIIKTKIDGTGWTECACGSYPYSISPSYVHYDVASDRVYTTSISAPYCKMAKLSMDLLNFDVLGGICMSGSQKFNTPKGILYDADTDFVYVADCYNHRIVKTKYNGVDWATYGSVGSGNYQFYFPTDLVYDDDEDMLYIADRDNYRIVQTKMDGSVWVELGGFVLPQAIAFATGAPATAKRNRVMMFN